GYAAIGLPIVFLLASVWLNPKWEEPADWKLVFARAEAARREGNLYEARWLYSQAGRVAFWYRDWQGTLAAACGMKKVDNARDGFFATRTLVVQAMIAAEIRESRAGLMAVAQAFRSLGEDKAAAMTLARVKPGWPADAAPGGTSPGNC
ncbi:MAG TPA: hypothetical protein VNO43_01710, partial [Candidatus Eisenbacteria bacterium]|nr:hypothetical protein [Candidatus Eisenbacteria bacterium]